MQAQLLVAVTLQLFLLFQTKENNSAELIQCEGLTRLKSLQFEQQVFMIALKKPRY